MECLRLTMLRVSSPKKTHVCIAPNQTTHAITKIFKCRFVRRRQPLDIGETDKRRRRQDLVGLYKERHLHRLRLNDRNACIFYGRPAFWAIALCHRGVGFHLLHVFGCNFRSKSICQHFEFVPEKSSTRISWKMGNIFA